MATIERFEDLEVWKASRCLAGKIYALSRQGSFSQDYGFRDQIRRAVVSVVSNIAEGFERHSNHQFLNFLDIAAGSAGEVRAQLYLALDFGYLAQNQFQDTFDGITRITQMLTKLMQYLRTTPNRLPSPQKRPPNAQPSNSQTVKPSNDQTAKRSNDQTIKRSNGQTSKRPNGQTVKPSNAQTVKRLPLP